MSAARASSIEAAEGRWALGRTLRGLSTVLKLRRQTGVLRMAVVLVSLEPELSAD